VADKWSVNADSTEFTFALRKGMKWSDGQPFTADDVVFSIEDCAKNSDLYKSVPSTLVIGGKPGTVTKVDDNTVKFTFEAVRPVPRTNWRRRSASTPRSISKHYCEPVPSQVQRRTSPTSPRRRACRLAGSVPQPSAATSRSRRAGRTPRRPTLDPWVIEEPYTGGATRVDDGAQPVLLAGRPAWQPAALHRPAHLQHLAGRRALMLDGLGPQYRLQACATSTLCRTSRTLIAEHAEGRLPPVRTRRDPVAAGHRST
jgi:hypothetical protein